MENERAQRRRGIYLLPNLLTTGALFAGFYAIVAAMGSRHHSAAVAGLLATLVWMASDLGLAGEALAVPALVLTLLAAGLMVSNLRYHSFKELDLRSRVPFVAVVAVVLVLAFGSIDPPKALFAAALVYALSGPALTLVEVQRRRNRRAARERLPR